MAVKIRIKYNTGAGVLPTSLDTGELAINTADAVLYTKDSTNAIVAIGVQGAQGQQGFQGFQGPQGLVGPQGVTGFTGFTGFVGLRGPQGSQGSQGFVGQQGAQSAVTGPQGLTGPQGSQGANGTTGPQGLTGAQGPQGFQGVPGASTGPQGVAGSQGPQGLIGTQGPLGSQGLTGAQGFQGPQGAQGVATGPAGAQGAVGAPGPQGPPGRTGPQGATGPTGAQGPQGFQGPQGGPGATGPTGPRGPQGPPGTVYTFYTVGGGSTCFLAGSMVLMADKSWKPIELVDVGDEMYSPNGGKTKCRQRYVTNLGKRKMYRMTDNSISWSSEHTFWVMRNEGQYLWTMDKEQLKYEEDIGVIKGIKNWEQIYEGQEGKGEYFGHIDGFKYNIPVEIPEYFGYDNLPLFLPLSEKGELIVVNGYIVGASVNEHECDYSQFKWNTKEK